jgi:FixJ family two-component response regulator
MVSGEVVCIVEEDESVRESLTGLLRSLNLVVQPFVSAQELLAVCTHLTTSCVILDLSAVEVERHLSDLGKELPLVFITSNYDAVPAIRELARGPIVSLLEPCFVEELLRAVRQATGQQS